MNNLNRKSILITGATSGIGRVLTIKLLKSGAFVCFCGKSDEKMKSLCKEIDSYNISNDNYNFASFDITDESKIVKFVSDSEEKFGKIDVLINNAGVNSAKSSIENIDTRDLEWMIKVNLIAPVVFMREVYKRMKKFNDGFILNVLSTVCLFSNEGIGAYTASKSGFDGITKVFRKEARKNNIRVTSLYPGGVNTPFREIEKKEYLTPEQVADTIISVISSDEKIALDEIVMRPFVETNYC